MSIRLFVVVLLTLSCNSHNLSESESIVAMSIEEICSDQMRRGVTLTIGCLHFLNSNPQLFHKVERAALVWMDEEQIRDSFPTTKNLDNTEIENRMVNSLAWVSDLQAASGASAKVNSEIDFRDKKIDSGIATEDVQAYWNTPFLKDHQELQRLQENFRDFESKWSFIPEEYGRASIQTFEKRLVDVKGSGFGYFLGQPNKIPENRYHRNGLLNLAEAIHECLW